MTQSDLKSLIDKGSDAGSVWAAVQNHCAQQIDAAKQEAFDAHVKTIADLKTAQTATEKSLAEEKSAHAQTLADAKNAIAAADKATLDAKVAGEKALADYKAQVASGLQTIRSIVDDPHTDTEKGIIAFVNEATKPEREKQKDALIAQKAELEKQLAALG